MQILPLLASTVLAATPVNIRVSEDLGTLDWGYGEVTQIVVNQLMEGLATVGEDAEPRPALAKRWRFSADGKKAIFTLKKAQWSDGVPVCADQFVAAWRRVLTPAFASPYRHYLYDIRGARAVAEGKAPSATLGARANGCGELIVEFEGPARHFPAAAAHWVLFPVRPDLIAKHGVKAFEPRHMAVTGPFTLKEWKRDEVFHMWRNPRYHGKATPTEALDALVVADDGTALTLFKTGKLQWMKDIPFAERTAAAKIPGYAVKPALIGYFLGFSMQEGPFTKRDARCALARSLDLAQIPRILAGGETPATGWVPRELLPAKAVGNMPAFDGAMARDLAQRGGLKREETYDLHYYAKDIHTPVMEWAQGQWRKNLDLNVRLVREEGKTYWGRLASKAPPLFLSGTTAWFAHPYSFLSELTGGSAANWGKYRSAAYDQAALRTLRTTTAARLASAVSEAEKQLLQRDCAIIPLYFRNTLMLTAPRCGGIEMNPLGVASFARMRCQ